MHSSEIEKLKGVISKSGQIEKVVDAEETWFTDKSLSEYARNLLIKDTNNINTIKLLYDYDHNFNLGDIIEINLPAFYCVGLYAITEIKLIDKSRTVRQFELTLKNSNLVSSYIDMFRPKHSDTDSENVDSLVVSDYVEEGVNEIHVIEEVEDESQE
jgi:hypothetical protein